MVGAAEGFVHQFAGQAFWPFDCGHVEVLSALRHVHCGTAAGDTSAREGVDPVQRSGAKRTGEVAARCSTVAVGTL